MALPKKIAWPIIIFALFWDGFLTVRAGGEGNPLWRPLTLKYGLSIIWLFLPFAVLLFYLLSKIFGFLIEKLDKYPQGEEIVLTSLVLVYGTYVLYLNFFVSRFGYLGSRSHYRIILLLIIPAVLYQIFLEIKKWKTKRNSP